MEKTKLLDWDAKKQRFTICTVIRNAKRMLIMNNEPLIAFHESHVQIGCIRLSYEFVARIAALAAQAGKRQLPYVYQQGTYRVKDSLGNGEEYETSD